MDSRGPAERLEGWEVEEEEARLAELSDEEVLRLLGEIGPE